jgi:hypothetical protein
MVIEGRQWKAFPALPNVHSAPLATSRVLGLTAAVKASLMASTSPGPEQGKVYPAIGSTNMWTLLNSAVGHA